MDTPDRPPRATTAAAFEVRLLGVSSPVAIFGWILVWGLGVGGGCWGADLGLRSIAEWIGKGQAGVITEFTWHA
ncbi:hypothetical protein E2562_023653 [Oryza meyeriana var. granulata]|uniref:Uncharacterized protein n=1 Tax=Oryza meyeriana var. granulata TaxID=110450 RepID=A0A6G1BNG7_9ORYZ|nr:hypothetical protein E2562_023653 [Oryza meyeriana var. granulata]